MTDATHADPPASDTRLDGPQTMPSKPDGWWEEERARLVRSRLTSLSAQGGAILDVGCGRGRMLDSDFLADRFRVAVDSHPWHDWADLDGIHFVRAEADRLPFRRGVFDVVGSFDVLEHLDDDVAGLAEQRYVASPGGAVVATVPADERLWSRHDDEVGHRRRYTGGTLRLAADRADLQTDECTHFFSFLWLPARLLRSSAARTSEPATSAGFVSRTVRSMVTAVCSLERAWLRRRRLPFGTSLLAVFVPAVKRRRE